MKTKALFLWSGGISCIVLVCIQLLSFYPPEVLTSLSKKDSAHRLQIKLKDEGFLRKSQDENTWIKKRLIGEWVVEIEPYQNSSLIGVLNLRSEYRHPLFRILNRSRNYSK